MTMKELMDRFAYDGVVTLIQVRPERGAEPIRIESVDAEQSTGLVGDRYSKTDGTRQVTLIQAEHLDAVASMLKKDSIDARLTRRNLVIRGINLLSLKGKKFRVGSAILEYTGECHPCSRMETNLGLGGYNAMRGHGGITARVVSSGRIAIGDGVVPIP
jgi:MOSC domain-containing protein YiiM